MTASQADTPLLEVNGLCVRLKPPRGTAFDAVHDVSFTLEAGETFCLVGESGCGKSMTALAIMGLVPEIGRISAGEVIFYGENLACAGERALRDIRGRRIGMVFQEPMTSLNPVLRVGDQVAEVLTHHLRLSRKEAALRVEELFRQVGIPSPELRVRDYPHQLSGGLRQRVMIAMALACTPSLVLADEPTTALDVTVQGQILALLREQAAGRGMGLLLITHDLGVVASMADFVGVMYAGYMVEKAPAADLFNNPLHPYTRGLMLSAPTLDSMRQERLHTIPGTVPSPGALPEGCPFRPRCPRAMPRCHEMPPNVCILGGTGRAEDTPESPEMRPAPRPRPSGREVRCWLWA